MPITPASPYGADSTGLICGYCFGADGRGHPLGSEQALEWLAQSGEPLGSEQALQWLAQSGEGAGFVWLHFNLAHAATEKWLRVHAAQSDVFLEALRDGARSTRVEMDDDRLVAVVNDVHYAFAFEPSDIATLWLLVTPRLVISARVAPLRSIDRLRHAVESGTALRSSVDLLVRLMQEQGDVLTAIVRESTKRVDAIEDQLLSGRLGQRRADLGALRRLLVRLQRLLAPEPAALFRLLQRPPPWVGEQDAQDLRQSTEEFNLALSEMTALQERIKLMQEEIAGRVAETNTRTLFVLTVVTVLALPINIVAGLLGMNVGGIPWAEHPLGFWIVVAIVAGISALATLVALRRRET